MLRIDKMEEQAFAPLLEEDGQQDDLFEHYRLCIDAGQAPMRIDRFLDTRMAHVSRNRIQNAIKAGSLLVNGAAIKSSYKVKPGDLLQLVLSHPPREKGIAPEDIPLHIDYEDDTLLVLQKPPGMVVHPGHGHHSGTLVNALVHYLAQLPLGRYPAELSAMEFSHKGDEASKYSAQHAGRALAKGAEIRPGLVHRIDKDTSGLLVIAKTDWAMTHLAKQFFDHSIQRTYRALVWGCPEEEGTYRAHIDRDPRDRQRMKGYADGSKGKAAVTHFRRLEALGPVSLMEYRLETGRTHQIRVHSSMHGHPIFNDVVYGGDKVLKGGNQGAYLKFVADCMAIMPRMALHAKTLGFRHPDDGRFLHFDAGYPSDFAGVLDRWRQPPPNIF